ncbi:fructose-bisphosphatase class II [Caulobacter segnis]
MTEIHGLRAGSPAPRRDHRRGPRARAPLVIHLITDGDVAGAINTTDPSTGIDLYLGSGARRKPAAGKPAASSRDAAVPQRRAPAPRAGHHRSEVRPARDRPRRGDLRRDGRHARRLGGRRRLSRRRAHSAILVMNSSTGKSSARSAWKRKV